MGSPLKLIYIQILLFILLLFLNLYAKDVQIICDSQELLAFFEKSEDMGIQKIEIELRVRQPLDHDAPEKGYFFQRVFLLHKDAGKPVVLDTEGYQASPKSVSELTNLLDANQIIVEHRYFGESVPDSIDYSYLNIRQAAADHHRIIKLFKSFYNGPWISTGISKGGQTAMYHKRFYPDDVDATVCYVSPLNFSEHDERITQFLNQVEPDTCRIKILEFQHFLLKNRERFLPLFRVHNRENNYEFSYGDSLAYEHCVLEYPFAFWQWGESECESLPDSSDPAAEIFQGFIMVSTPYYFSNTGRDYYAPYFVQAFSEIGYYGYHLQPFAGELLYINDGSYRFCVPENADISFDPSVMQDMSRWINANGTNMIFIYGSNDPWSASAIQLTGKTNAIKIVLPGGSHRTRIRDLPAPDKEIIYSSLEKWLGIQIVK